MSKTPVSILQELMVTRGDIPHYELLLPSEGIRTHLPTYNYRVLVGDVHAIGTARSKKDAKHEAAKRALEKLAELGLYHPTPGTLPKSPSPTLSPNHNPSSPIQHQVNVIGYLSEFCSLHKMQEPEFQLTADVGPPHLRQFTMECKVGIIKLSAKDLTKKKAKQRVAQKMLQRLQEMLPEVPDEIIQTDTLSITRMEIDDVIRIYNEKSAVTKKKINRRKKIASYHCVLTDIMTEKNMTYNDLWKDITEKNSGTLQNLMNRLELSFSIDFDKQENYYIALISINSDPEFKTYGKGPTKAEAAEKGILEMFAFLQIMSQ